jgi:putative hydrolase of the HAD superfamily
MRAVTFDVGNTLVDLDSVFLSTRLREKGVAIDAKRLDEAQAAVWRALTGKPVWPQFMRSLLQFAGAPDERILDLADWLHSEQPLRNLWRKPVPGMIELVRRLRVPVALISNSEGRLRELIEELGWRFEIIADSHLVGAEKPDARIFAWTADRLGVAPEEIVHVGDSWAADVEGALGAGFSAIWFRGDRARQAERIRVAQDATEVESALRALGIAAGT